MIATIQDNHKFMLTENQQKYLNRIPADKTVRIVPFDPKISGIVQEIKDKVKNAGINLEVNFIGASALGISGQGDIDLYILCPEKDFQIYLPKLEEIFGQKVQEISIIKWQFERGGHEIEMYLTDPTTPSMQEQIKVFEVLKNDPRLLKEYEKIKSSSDGLSFQEYMRRKYEFLNQILSSDEKITVDGKTFAHVKTREYTPVSIYQNEDSFLRIGPKDLILPELNLHKNLLEFDFPVPKIISEGEKDGKYYYIETSLGKILLGDIFWEDYKKSGFVSDDNFKILLSLTEKFAKAQIKTAKSEKAFESFYYGVHMDYILEELPHLKEKIITAFEKVKERLSASPIILTHGDFNAYNLFEEGIIDFGNSFEAPAGYDLVSNIYHTYLFPKGGDFESTRRYEFSTKQINDYFSLMDDIYLQNNFPKLSDFISEFIFTRTIWSAVRMQRYPKVQEWRYKKFEKILENYLSDGDVIDAMLHD